MNRIMLTTLPCGRVRDAAGHWNYRWNVLVSLRLAASEEGARLGDYPAFLDWPAVVAAAEFAVEYTAEEGVAGHVVKLARQPAPDSALWAKLFGPDLPVLPYETPEADRKTAVRSYDGGKLAGDLREVYAASLLTSGRAARVRPLLGKFAPPDESSTVTIRELVEEPWPAIAAAQFRRYHDRTDADPPTAGDEEAPTDFHRATSIVTDYPALSRSLGLVLAFQLWDSALPLPPSGLVRTRMAGVEDTDAAIALPWTAYETEGPATERLATFHPRPSDAAHEDAQSRGGFVAIANDHVTLVQEPLADAMLTLGAYARDEARESRTADGDAALSLPPALPASGIGLFDRRSGPVLADALGRRPALETWLAGASGAGADGAELVLYAEDLTAGYRVDVQSEGRTWHSLCERSVDFHISGDEAGWTGHDEGYVSPTGKLESKDQFTVVKTTDALFDWQGWSLVVSPPGKAEAEDGGVQQDLHPDDPDFPLVTDISVRPGSLEPQRFGRRYSFRCRSTDVAGQSWTRDEADALVKAAGGPLVSEPRRYLRYEQVGAPCMTPAIAPGLGETGEVIAIGNDPPGGGRRKREAAVHILPPRATVQLAERHGVFDAMSATESWNYIAAHQGSVPGDYDPATLKELAVRGSDGIRVPYLADPLAHGIVLLDLPGAGGPVGPIAFPRDGGEVHSILLRLAPSDSEQPPSVRRDGAVTVYLTPGTSRAIRIASVPRADDVDLLAYSTLRPENAATHGEPPPLLPQRLENGEVPLVAPALELTLVHAVQRPTAPARFGSPTLTRTFGSITASLEDADFTVHAASTARIDVYARWQDRIDADRQWRYRPGRTQAFHADVDAETERALSGVDTQHDYPDTRFRMARYSAVATSRYTDFYAESDPAAYTVTSESDDLPVFNTAPPAPPEPAYVVPTFRWSVEKDGERLVRERSGGGLRLYLRRPWFSSGDNEQLAVVFAARTREEVPDWISRHVSRWGFNPVMPATTLPPYPSIENVTDRDHTTIAWPVPPNWRDEETPADAKHTFNMACYAPTGEADEELLFCDIELDSGASYMPVIRLALARYQPSSVGGAEFSALVHSDAVQLMPARSLSLGQSKRQVTLALEGVGYPRDTGGDGGVTTAVSAHFERRNRNIADDALGWEPVSDAVLLDPESLPGQRLRWQTGMTLPDRSQDPLRLVVAERERYDSDARASADGPDADAGRLVYLDIIDLGR
jgi:hypothetical protein